jgi:hypothetical protein
VGTRLRRVHGRLSNWSRSANTSANKTARMEQADSFKPSTKARFSATTN